MGGGFILRELCVLSLKDQSELSENLISIELVR